MTDSAEQTPRIFEVDIERFQQDVITASASQPILVDFWADWCGPCHALAPHLERTLTDFGGRVQLAKVEVDEGENMKLAGHYRLRGFPTVILFYRGAEVARFSGAMSRYRIRDWLRAQLPEDLAGSEVV